MVSAISIRTRISTVKADTWALWGILAGYALVRLVLLAGIPPTTHFDSDSYLEQYREGFGGGFFGRGRPWGYPAVLWLVGFRPTMVVWLQKIFAIAGWSVMAWSMTQLAASRAGKWCGFLGILGVSLTLTAVQWDISILTESLTLALLALLGGCWVTVLTNPARRWAALGFFAAGSVFFAALRDANNILLPLFAVALLLESLRWTRVATEKPARLRAIISSVVAAMMLLIIFALHHADLGASGRSWPNVANVLSRRALVREGNFGYAYTHVEHLRWLQEHHDIPDEAALRVGKSFSDPPPLSEEYRQWLREHGARAWTGFVFAHPRWALGVYVSDTPLLADPGTAYLNPSRWPRARLWLPQTLQTGVMGVFGGLLAHPAAHGTLLAVTLLLGFAWLGTLFSVKFERFSFYCGTIFFLCGIALLSTAIAVLGDAMEIWRHGLNGTVAVYMIVPVMLAAIADAATLVYQHSRSGNRKSGGVTQVVVKKNRG